MKIGFYVDKAEELQHETFTGRLLVEETKRRNHRVEVIRDFTFQGRDIYATLFDGNITEVGAYDLLFFRKVPFDEKLMDALKDVELPPCINHPKIIVEADKRYMAQFPEHTPSTIFTSDIEEAVKRILSEGKSTIKPVKESRGIGIRHVNPENTDRDRIKEIVISAIRKYGEIAVQEFLPEVKDGDKRVVVLNGIPVGAYLRTDRGDGICNVTAGGGEEKATITEKERQIIEATKEIVLKDGGYLLGYDFIGERLIEINAACPGGINRINRFQKPGERPLEELTLDFAEELARR
jgi:glutathione synthase